jgi:hypothetical protein
MLRPEDLRAKGYERLALDTPLRWAGARARSPQWVGGRELRHRLHTTSSTVHWIILMFFSHASQ